MQFSESFRAMDTDIDVVIEALAPPIDAFVSLKLLFEQQEQRFSRFRPNSELCRLNRGEAITDSLFAKGCHLALEAHEFTGGLYNPMVLPALEEAGYRTTFRDVRGGTPRTQRVPDPGECIDITGDRVRLTAGAVDLGGIVKGWTVDLGIELLGGRFTGVFLNAGGDLRCSGSEEGLEGWFVTIEAGSPGGPPPWEGVMRGAVATSTTRKRRWQTDSGAFAHHLIDPRSGLPADSPFEQVTAWAAETWRAECWAKAVLIGGPPAGELAASSGVRVMTCDHDGSWNS
jgi:thiamine biosynthesis lipoprotein